ncbi:MAG: hypothetical protein ACRYFX_11715 [Janthinobacterium lividum]
MFISSKNGLLGFGLVASVLVAACQTQKEGLVSSNGLTVAATPNAKQQVLADDLAARIAKDPLMQAYVQANEDFLNKHDALVANTPSAEKAGYQQNSQRADELLNFFGSPEEQSRHEATQEERVNQLKTKYELTKLSDEVRMQVASRAMRLAQQQLKER